MIYCIEDEKNIRDLLVYTLNSAGYAVKAYGEGKDFFENVDYYNCELILLDIMLPGIDGLSILKRLRADGKSQEVPVILLTAKGSEYDKALGLDLGADDYIAKPFGMLELLARIRAVLRRTNKADKENILRFEMISLNKQRHKVLVEDKIVDLTLKEFLLLEYLLENVGFILSREQLLSRVWGYDFNGESRTIDVHVRTLRQKLGNAGKYLYTVRGVGYGIGDEY